MGRKRLHKSSDVVISGVCGGIAEYFDVDATLVRILTVVLFIAGLGFPIIIYVVCMFVMPPDPGVAQGYVDTRAERTPPPCSRLYNVVNDACAGHNATASSGATQPPPPDPSSRVTAAGAAAYAAENAQSNARYTYDASTVDVGASGAATMAGSASNADKPKKSHWPTTLWFGAVLVAIGVIALLCNLVHLSLWRCWPLVIVVAGLVSLFTPGYKGWSLERAGNSIVLITVGLALLAWMLQIVPFRVFVAAFHDLWPLLLVVAGTAIIGSAQKSSFIKLFASLILSATIILGVWFYSGIDWSTIGSSVLFMEGDVFGELMADLTIHR